MSLQENTFYKQSAINDENEGGGALSESVGGTAANTGSPLDSLKSLTDAKDSIFGQLSKIPLSSFFANGKFQFPSDLLNKLKIDNLMNALTDALSKGMNISDIFKNGIQGLFSSFLSQLKLDANDTWIFLKQATGSFSSMLLGKTMSALISQAYIPDYMFLSGLYTSSLGGKLKESLDYKDGYIRKLCLMHDMPLSLAFVDSVLNITYSANDQKRVKDAIRAARAGSIEVVHYILTCMNKELNELKACYPLPKRYSREKETQLRNKYNNLIGDTESIINGMISGLSGSALESVLNSVQYKSLNEKLELYKTELSNLFIDKEDEYRKDPMYEKIQTLIKEERKNMCKIIKTTVVYAYSNLTLKKLRKFLRDFDIDPRMFGTTDSEYGKVCFLNDSDINIMAPIVKSRPNETLGGFSKLSKETQLIPDVDIKLIYPRNAHIKKIYIYLASSSIHGEYKMINPNLYERLKLPVYDTVISSFDSAYGGLYKTGLGKLVIGSIKTIDEAAYVYAKSVEKMLYKASNTKYLSFNSLKALPAPTDEDLIKNNEKKITPKPSPDGTLGSSKANLSKAASGPSAPSVIDFKYEIVNSITNEDIVGLLKTYGLTDDQIAILPLSMRKERIVSIWNTNNTTPENILNNLSIESLRNYMAKVTGKNASEFASLTKEELVAQSKEFANKTSVDEQSSPTDYLTFDDMKRYLRKYKQIKEGEIYKYSLVRMTAATKNCLNEQRRRIFYPKSFEFNGYDAEGFPILGYPSSEDIQKAVENKQNSSWSIKNPNGYPVNESGLICPIIGYNASGKAMYGTPLFYGDIDPIAEDARGLSVFAYYKDTAILDDVDKTENEIKQLIQSNEDKIAELNGYIDNGASGILKTSYQKTIRSLTKSNDQMTEMLESIEIKPVVGYNEYGVRVFGTMNNIYNVLTPDNIVCLGYDQSGNIVYEYDEDGHTILGRDINNNYIYGTAFLKPLGLDENGRTVYGFNEENEPVYGFTKNKKPVIEIEYENGLVKNYKISNSKLRSIIGMTDNLEPIFEYDNNGKPVISYDKNGKGIVELYTDYEIKVYRESNEKAIDNIIDKLYPTLNEFVNAKIYNNQGTETSIKKYIKEHMITGELIEFINSSADKDEYFTDPQMEFIYSYQEKINELYERNVIYDRILNEDPKPVVIGKDPYGTPILGEPLITEKIPGPKELLYSSTNATDFGFSESDVSSSEKSNVLDKKDIDLKTEYVLAEKEIISSIQGKTISLEFELIYS